MKVNKTISTYITLMFALCLDGHSPDNKLILPENDREHIDSILDNLSITDVLYYQNEAAKLLQKNTWVFI